MVESHLGDVCGEALPPMRPIKRSRYRTPGWIERGTQLFLAWFALGIFGVLIVTWLVLMFVFFTQPSLAHGPAEWIQQGNYKNAAGELCCGERDCFEIADSDVRIAADGYRVTLRTPTLQGIAVYLETVPFAEAAPSPDGHYWRCQWGGQRKCFFAPPGQT